MEPTIRELWSFYKEMDYVGKTEGALLVGTVAAIFVLGFHALKNYEYRNQLISQLPSYVEMFDGKPGISFLDQIDFAQRAGIPTNKVVEGPPIDFSRFETSDLERALQSYQSD